MPRRKPQDEDLIKHKPLDVTQFAQYDQRGRKLQRMREKADISKWYMAHRLGIDINQINSIESGLADVDYDTAEKLYRQAIKYLIDNSAPSDPNRELRWSAPRMTDKAENW
jgi:ribosome-binding protein aMBF1 (putative translation factor)